MTIRKTVALLSAAACASALLTALPVLADSSGTPTTFPVVKAIAVDEANGRVFVSGSGSGSFNVPLFDYVEVFDPTGRPVGRHRKTNPHGERVGLRAGPLTIGEGFATRR